LLNSKEQPIRRDERIGKRVSRLRYTLAMKTKLSYSRTPILLLLCFLLVACAPSPTPQLTAKQIAQQASAKMLAVKTLHFTMDLQGRSKVIDPLGALVLRRAEGDLASPDKAQSKIKVAISGLIVEVRAIGIGDKQWMTNPLTQRWEPLPANWGYNPAVLFDGQKGIPSLLSRVENLQRIGDENYEGKNHYRLTGKITGKEVAPFTAYMITGSEVSFTLWLGADDFLIRKIVINEKDGDAPEATEWVMVLSAFDKPVNIAAPVVQ
jgi:hypothetical protein